MVLHHTTFGVTSISTSKTFYLAALAPLGYKEIFNFGEKHIGLGANGKPDLWLKDVGADGSPVKGLHLAFGAESRQVVDEFYQAALYVISSLIFEGLILNKLSIILLVVGGQVRRTMAHRERGTTSQDTMQPLSLIRTVTTSKWSTLNRRSIERGDERNK